MSNTLCELFARDSAYNFSFSCIKRSSVKYQNIRWFQTQSHNNLWFLSNMILFFFFGNYLVSTMILITMIPSIQKNVYHPFVFGHNCIGWFVGWYQPWLHWLICWADLHMGRLVSQHPQACSSLCNATRWAKDNQVSNQGESNHAREHTS